MPARAFRCDRDNAVVYPLCVPLSEIERATWLLPVGQGVTVAEGGVAVVVCGMVPIVPVGVIVGMDVDVDEACGEGHGVVGQGEGVAVPVVGV